jgi:hypothetical protein
VPWAGLVPGESSGQSGEKTIHGTVLRGLGFGSSDDPLLCVRAIQEADATVDEHVLVAAAGEDRDGAVFGCAPVPANERDQAPQLSSRGREAGRRQRVSRREVCSPNRTDAGAGGGVPVEGGRQQAAAGVNVAGVSSGVGGKRVDRSECDGLSNARAGWEIVPPRNRVEKRSAADRVAGLSDNAKRWVGMVHKGRKRAAAPVNSQKKRLKKGYVDCWDVLDAVDSESVSALEEPRNASAAERDRVFLEESGFPSDND